MTMDLEERRGLQEQFERAQRALRAAEHGQGREKKLYQDQAVQMLTACGAADPTNLIYVDSLLASCRLLRPGADGGRSLWGRLRASWNLRSLRRLARREAWMELLTDGLKRVAEDPWDVDVLLLMAQAARNCQLTGLELRYLETAVGCHAGVDRMRRAYAYALSRSGQFAQAVDIWQELLSAADSQQTDDKEAFREVALLSAPTIQEDVRQRMDQLRGRLDHSPAEVETRLELFSLLVEARRFSEAQRLLEKTPSRGADLKLQDAEEQLELARLQYKLDTARRWADEHDEDWILEDMEAELLRVEIQVFSQRVERYPDDLSAARELAEALQRAGNFRAALPLLERIADSAGASGQLAIGEARQRLRQFDQAASCYENALRDSSAGDEDWLRAAYRLGVLREAEGRLAQAEAHFAALEENSPNYRDAGARLDRIREIRNN